VVDRGALGHAKKEYSRGHEFGAMTSLAFQNTSYISDTDVNDSER